MFNKRQLSNAKRKRKYDLYKQERQCTYNITMRWVRESLLPWERYKYYTLVLCLRAQACGLVHERA